MRLKDKLIRKNCPACGGEIALGASALDKKINCPKCLKTVVIPNGNHARPEKPSGGQPAVKEKRNGRPAQSEEPIAVPGEPRVFIERFDTEEEISLSEPETEAGPVSGRKGVIYCLSHGTLTQRKDNGGSAPPGFISGDGLEI